MVLDITHLSVLSRYTKTLEFIRNTEPVMHRLMTTAVEFGHFDLAHIGDLTATSRSMDKTAIIQEDTADTLNAIHVCARHDQSLIS